MAADSCPGWVEGLQGQTVLITGKLRLRGEWVQRDECRQRIANHGGTWKTDFARDVTLLVTGEQKGRDLSDNTRGYSKKLVAAQRSMEAGGPHVHVVDQAGFEALLHNQRASCSSLRSGGGGPVALPVTAPALFGEPLRARNCGLHAVIELQLDLSKLDEGTAAHEGTIKALISYLSGAGVAVRTPGLGMPRFDAGWQRGDTRFVAEVKSLGGANETQQIRLGLGQILDYAYAISRSESVTPVLVLERQPAEAARWKGVAGSVGVVLTWAPGFAGI